MKLCDNTVYEDNHLLVLNKPFGLLTQPTQLVSDSLETRGKAWLKEKYQKPFNVFLHPIHRLDRAAGGLVVFAKTSKALSRLGESLRERQWKKVYRLRTDPPPTAKKGTLIHFLVHDEFRARVAPEGKRAVLSYIVDTQGIIEVDLETGRYHQIRAQFAAIGSPVVGDKKYGGKPHKEEGILLQHVACSFPHPVREETMDIALPACLLHPSLI